MGSMGKHTPICCQSGADVATNRRTDKRINGQAEKHKILSATSVSRFVVSSFLSLSSFSSQRSAKKMRIGWYLISCQSGADVATNRRTDKRINGQAEKQKILSATSVSRFVVSSFSSFSSQRSAKKMRIGCTKAYYLFAFVFVSGSRCAPYHNKLLADSAKICKQTCVALNHVTTQC